MESLRLALEMREKESDRYWSRSNIILLVQCVLVATFGNIHTISPLALAICVIGLSVSFIWLGVLYKGKCYVSRWDYAAKKTQQDLLKSSKKKGNDFIPILSYYETAKTKEHNPRFFIFNYNTTTLMKWCVIVMIFFWLFCGIWKIIEPTDGIIATFFNSSIDTAS